jgi:hypothetical protein
MAQDKVEQCRGGAGLRTETTPSRAGEGREGQCSEGCVSPWPSIPGTNGRSHATDPPLVVTLSCCHLRHTYSS